MSMITIDVKIPVGITGLPEAIAKALPEVMNDLRNDISSEAQKALQSTRHDYQKNIRIATYPINTMAMRRSPQRFGVVTLNGFLANAVESGWSGGNMVAWLVKPPSGTGQYASIRFRHTGPGTSGAHGTPMGSMEHKRGMSKSQAQLVGKAIARAAKKSMAEASAPHKADHAMSNRMSANVAAQAGGLIMKGSAKGAKKHSASVYTGMRGQQDSAGTQYESFRRASIHVSGKWIHPGISAHNFFGKALTRLPKHVKRLIKHTVEGMRTVT